MKLYFIRRLHHKSPVVKEVYALLAERGFDVEEGVPEEALNRLDMTPRHDLYILKAREPLPVSIAGAFHHLGARLLNPYMSCVTILNKFVTTAMMRSAGIPTPPSWAVADLRLAYPLMKHGPHIIKPFQGIHGDGVTLVRSLDELEHMAPPQEPALVQRFIEGCTWRFKVFGVGEQIFATRKPFSLGEVKLPGEAWPVSPGIRDIALRCGELFGLGLFGLDVVEGPDGPVVVDLNSFPGYGSQPGIARVIAAYIEGYANGRHVLHPPATLPVAGALLAHTTDSG